MLDPGASLQLAGLHIPPVGSQRVHSLHIVYPLKLIRAGCGTRFRGMRSLTFAACGSKTLFSIIFATSPLAKSWIRACKHSRTYTHAYITYTHVSFGGDTKSRRSLLSGVYARGSKRPHQSALECVTVVDSTAHSKLPQKCVYAAENAALH